jgi:hypothetical protein
VVQHQHALSADGLRRRLGAEDPAGTGRQRDASGWLHADDPVPSLRYGPVAVQLVEQGQRRPWGGRGNCRTRVFKWGRGTLTFKFHLRHRLLGWNPLNGVGGGTRNNALRPFDASPEWGPPHVRGRIEGNPVREVGTTDLWLPAA